MKRRQVRNDISTVSFTSWVRNMQRKFAVMVVKDMMDEMLYQLSVYVVPSPRLEVSRFSFFWPLFAELATLQFQACDYHSQDWLSHNSLVIMQHQEGHKLHTKVSRATLTWFFFFFVQNRFASCACCSSKIQQMHYDASTGKPNFK